MAMGSLFAHLRRLNLQSEATRTIWRLMSSGSIDHTIANSGVSGDELRRKLLRLKSRGRSAVTVLQNSIDDGYKVSISEIRRITRQLAKSKRYDHALEILTWMETQNGFQMSAADHAIRLELVLKVHGLTKAEEYFGCLTSTASQKAACLPLLHGYVKEKAVERAEALMTKLNGLGLTVSPHPFNEMMKLYIGASRSRKVQLVISHMKKYKIPLNVLSYNIWMNACGELSGVTAAENVYKEMANDKNVEVGWSSISTLANIYIKAGHEEKALLALKNAEGKLSSCNRLGYFFLITLYASLNNIVGVLRVWEASKAVQGRMTNANYMCMLLCLVKLGYLVEAERIFKEWEANCWKYDIRVSNVLLAAYMRNQFIEKAESLHLRTLEKGGHPNYKTWEILMEGWVKSQNMDKAVQAMKKGLALVKQCDWRPSHSIVMAISEYIEKHRTFEDANQYVTTLHHVGLAILPVYKSLLRMLLCAHRPVSDILKMMEKDKINMDNETLVLIRGINEQIKS